MNLTLITQLNQLNQRFYHTTAKAFDQTRQNPWTGWQKLSPWLEKVAGAALDLGCGNGRWQRFLLDQWPEKTWHFTGLDNSPDLLTKAADQTPVRATSTGSWQQFDLVETWINTPNHDLTPLTQPPFHQRYDLITLFGVLHHLPSLALRQAWLTKLATHLNPHGLLIFTYWQFDHEQPRFDKKAFDPKKLNLDSTQLEPGDLILDWRQGTPAYRYCHLTDEIEIENNNQLLRATGLTLQTSFLADGKSEVLNQYQIWQRPE